MPQDNAELNAAKRAYRNAKAEGNHQEEARWANVIGNNLKNRGQYVEALKWLRIDYEVTVKYLPAKHLLPSCQSLGEIYLRLEYYKDALIYQKKHLELAKDADDLVEQQRASTQLGRTYHEMFSRSEDDHCSVRNAKKYFKSAMKLAKTLKDNPGSSKCSFLKEYIDAHNNLGMLEMDLDNLVEAHKILTKGLEICDEEEVIENDDGRSRLHHNLGNVYLEMRMWDEARKHIEKDVIICNKIGHCQGEAKGYINLGELYYRVQKYDDALLCYHKALDLAKSMEDEDALVRQVEGNIETANEAMKVMADLKKEEQNLKKLVRYIANARGTPRERKCLLQQLDSLDCLIEKARLIFAWKKSLEFAKRKKRVASDLCDKEKLSDSFLVIGDSYQKLRKFEKAFKWHSKSWEMYKSIGNLEGQAMAKINIGDVLDYDGKWNEALNAFEESYRIAVEANLPAVQLSALENMHYCHMIRFDNIDEARRLQALIDHLKQSNKGDLETQKVLEDCCSETDTEANEQFSVTPEASCSSMMTNSSDCRSHSKEGMIRADDDIMLISLLRSQETFSKMKASHINKQLVSASPIQVSPKILSKSAGNEEKVVGRKRVRIVLSDDEGEMLKAMELSKGRHPIMPSEKVATSITLNSRSETDGFTDRFQEFAAPAHYGAGRSSECVEESTSSYKCKSDNKISQDDEAFRSSSNQGLASESAASGSKREIDIFKNLLHAYDADHLKLHHSDDGVQRVPFKIDNILLHVEVGSFLVGDKLDTESLKDELACLYYLQLPEEKKSEGLLPVIESVSCDGRVMKSLEMNDNLNEDGVNTLVETVIHGWVSKPLIKLYINYCKELSEVPNMKLLKKLYNLECSDDEIAVSECDLQDLSISPLVNALHVHKTFAVLDLSHNFLGNGTAEKIQRVFTLSGQSNDLTLDLHCNRFGPTTLYQICECPVLFTRLQVLNISGNRLTDACGTYLSTILKNCKGLWSLNIERCSITSRTIQKVADALHTESTLEQLCLGYNNPISQNVLINLLVKLETLNRLTKLNVNGLKLNKPVIDNLIHLVKAPRFSGLMIGDTGVGTDEALQLTESLFNGTDEFVKLDVSYCGLMPAYFLKLNKVSQIHRIHELNLAGNSLMTEGCNAVTSLLRNPHCWLKILILNNCQLGHDGVLQVIQALQENCHLEELNLANNINLDEQEHLPFNFTEKQKSEPSESSLKESSSAPCLAMEIDTVQHDLGIAHPDYNGLEVADSEDGPHGIEAASGIDNSCVSSCYRNPSSLKTNSVMELLAAVELANTLQLLDLSNNGFLAQHAETLFNAWSNSRVGLAISHIKDKTIHLSVKGVKCCVRPCCRKE